MFAEKLHDKKGSGGSQYSNIPKTNTSSRHNIMNKDAIFLSTRLSLFNFSTPLLFLPHFHLILILSRHLKSSWLMLCLMCFLMLCCLVGSHRWMTEWLLRLVGIVTYLPLLQLCSTNAILRPGHQKSLYHDFHLFLFFTKVVFFKWNLCGVNQSLNWSFAFMSKNEHHHVHEELTFSSNKAFQS